MSLNFPNNPSEGDLFQDGINTYQFDGRKWKPLTRSYVITKQNIIPTGAELDNFDINLSSANFFEMDITKSSNVIFSNLPQSNNTSRFFLKINTKETYEDEITTYYDIRNLIADNVTSVDLSNDSVYSFKFADNGNLLFILNYSTETVTKYELTIPYDITTTFNPITSPTLATYFSNISDFYLSPDGNKIFIIAIGGTSIATFNTTIPWDVSNYIAITNTGIPSMLSAMASFTFSQDGNYFYILEYGLTGNDSLYQYSLSVPFDLTSTIQLVHKFADFGNITDTVAKVRISPDGRYIFISNRTTNFVELRKYKLDTPYMIATMRIEDINKNINGVIANTFSFEFNPNGTKFYRLASSGGIIDVYSSSNINIDSSANITWPDNIKWENNQVPVLGSIGKSTLLSFYSPDGGLTFYGRQIINNL